MVGTALAVQAKSVKGGRVKGGRPCAKQLLRSWRFDLHFVQEDGGVEEYVFRYRRAR